jgi:hypothetical protein
MLLENPRGEATGGLFFLILTIHAISVLSGCPIIDGTVFSKTRSMLRLWMDAQVG